MKQTISLLVMIIAVSVFAGCTLGSEHRIPEAPLPSAYKEAGPWRKAAPRDEAPRGPWWEIYGDERLNTLQERAAKGNPTLQLFLARMAQVRAGLGAARADRLPRIDLNPSAARARSAADFSPGGEGTTGSVFTLPLDLGYEIDLWGRVRRAVEAAGADFEASVGDYHGALLFVQAEVARTYFILRALDAEHLFLSRAVELRRENLRMVRSRFEAGETGRLDLSRAETELALAEGDAVAVARERALFENALAVLLGEPPSDFTLAPRPLDLLPPSIAPGLPATLLERRPDIAAAERRMAAANARIGVAQTAFFPAVRLFGSAGFQSGAASDLFSWDNRTWGLGPALSLPIFDGGRNRAGLRRAEALWEETAADYRGTVLAAVREVEDGLSGLRLLADQAVFQEQALRSAREAAELSRTRYRAGMVSYLEVVDAERTVLLTERQAARILGQRLETSVLLVKALGGGWEEVEAGSVLH